MEKNQETSTITAVALDKDQWLKNLSHFDHSIFMLPQWLDVVATPQRIPIFIDFFENNNVVAKTSGLIIKDSKIKGKQLFFYSAPAFISDNLQTYQKCLEALVLFAKQQHHSRINMLYFDQRISHKPSVKHFRSFQMNEAVIELQTDYKQFTPGSSLRKKRNTAIRMSTTYFHSRDHHHIDRLSELAEITLKRRKKLHQSNYKKLEFPYFNETLLPKLMNSGLGNMYCSLNPDGLTHYISVTIEHEKSIYGMFNGCDEFGYQYGLPGFVLLRISQDFMAKGFERFNLGGVPPTTKEHDKLLQFKEETGGKVKTYYATRTDFLVFPQTLINPVINIARKMPYNNITRKLVSLLRF